MQKAIANPLMKMFCSMLIVAFTMVSYNATVANAGMIGTQDVLTQTATDNARAKVATFLQRQDVEQAMIAQGVVPAEVQQRVASLTDEEINTLAGQIDQMPAGASVGTVVGAVVFVFVLLLVTDILGWTKVYPFTRSIR